MPSDFVMAQAYHAHGMPQIGVSCVKRSARFVLKDVRNDKG
jgi:hypothetical protein